ncbi:MAG: cytochrome P450 [Chloroflexi bacterium]|nr:cytochrome P450 [Chloroflexota bacterium]
MKGRTLGATRRVLGNGLLTSAEGEFHKRQRRLVQPALHRQRIAVYAEVMTSFAEQQMADWRTGQTRDLHRELMKLTMAIVAKCLFDADVSGEADRVGAAMTGLLEDFSPIDASPLGRLFERLPTPRTRRRQRNAKSLDDAVYRIIGERRASGEDRGDLLSMLLQAQDTEGDGVGMSDGQLRDEVMTLFLAGHETTANALAWTFYLLSQNPKVEARLHAELDAVLGSRLPTLADGPQLKYTRMVFSEAMRLYPPAWVIGRQAVGRDAIGGYVIPKRATVLMSQYVMHCNPAYWVFPNEFRPERFDPDVEHQRPRFAYFPFGNGPRVCIGEAFAWMEGDMLVASIAQRYRFKLSSEAVVEPEPSITLRLKHGLPVVLRVR